MKIPCDEIASELATLLTARVHTLRKKGIQPFLAVVLIGRSEEQLSFIRIKEKIAATLGIMCEVDILPESETIEFYQHSMQMIAERPEITGVIIQLPLPTHIRKENLHNVLPADKDVEGLWSGNMMSFPLARAVLTGLKYIAVKEINAKIQSALYDEKKDYAIVRNFTKGKSIVIAGRGETGGKPIAALLSKLQIPFNTVHTQTTNTRELFQNADIIITATGTHLINSTSVRKGVILLNVGLHSDQGKLKSDYDEHEMSTIASYYTVTPGGLGPIDVLYLYANMLDLIESKHPAN